MKPSHFPFSRADDHRPQMGLKPLDLADWIQFGADEADQLRLKRELLENERESVLQALPSSEAGCFELRDIVADHLASHFPDKFEKSAKPSSAKEALKQVALWTQEDWALLSPNPPVILEAGCICFPSRWDFRSKLGLGSDAIHAPVPRFGPIAKPTQGFLERISVDKPMWRLNWTLHDSDQLFCPGAHRPREGLTQDNVIENVWLRLERQTLRRLPASGFVAFSIRTTVTPLREVVSDPDQRAILKESLSNLPEEAAIYKGMGHFHRILTNAL